MYELVYWDEYDPEDHGSLGVSSNIQLLERIKDEYQAIRGGCKSFDVQKCSEIDENYQLTLEFCFYDKELEYVELPTFIVEDTYEKSIAGQSIIYYIYIQGKTYRECCDKARERFKQLVGEYPNYF